MKSRRLKNLVAGGTILTITGMVVPARAINADLAPTTLNWDDAWTLNASQTVNPANNPVTFLPLSNTATNLDDNFFSIEEVKTGVITTETSVTSLSGTKQIYNRDDRTGGYARIGMEFDTSMFTGLDSLITNAVSEHRRNINTVNSNKHDNGANIETTRQVALANKIAEILSVENNKRSRFIVQYNDANGNSRTTAVDFDQISLDMPNVTGINQESDLNSLVDENGRVYLTLRGLPTGVQITGIELDSRSPLYAVVTSSATEVTEYTVQKNVNYSGGNIDIPASTWILTDSLWGEVGGNIQYQDKDKDNVIENGEHVFVNATGTTLVVSDLFADPDKVIESVEFVDRRGDSYQGEVGDFQNVSHIGGTYVDVKINGLTPRTNYEFQYMNVNYKYNGETRTQRVTFDNSQVTGGVTGTKYLEIATADNEESVISAYQQMLSGSFLTQVAVGENSLTYLVKVSDVTNFKEIDVRGLRGTEQFTVTRIKDSTGKKDSNWFAVELTNLDSGRDYSFVSLEVIYDENGRERVSIPVSLGRRASDLNSSLFPSNELGTAENNYFTTTNGQAPSEVWVSSEFESEQMPGGVRLIGRVKDADNSITGATVYVQEGGKYVPVDDSRVNVKTSYRQTKGMDVNSDGDTRDNVTIDYPFIGKDQNGDTITVKESLVESASKTVEIEVTGLKAGTNQDFKIVLETENDGRTVSVIRSGDIGAFGSIPNGTRTKTQSSITRYAEGRTGKSEVVVANRGVKVSEITSTTAKITADVKNPQKESIEVSLTGAEGAKVSYDTATNSFKLTGLKSLTEYSNIVLNVVVDGKTVKIDVPTFTTDKVGEVVEGGVVGYVNRAYTEFFGRDAEQTGLIYWTDGLVKGTITLRDFLTQIAFTPELLERNITDRAFIEATYAMVDRQGEAEGINFWVAEIEKSMAAGETRAQARALVVGRMIETPEVKAMAEKLGVKFE